MKYGLIGKTLKHSYSKIIHQQFFGYDYELIELDSLDEFFLKKDFCGINVTFPYKEDVIKFCDKLDSSAIEVGCVNVITNRNGFLTGYNTDYFGLKFTFEKNNIDILGKKALILGSGGTSKTASCVLKNC
ncbi:MAG: shikimate dehydrogenase, partial [Oscillospiraceae bacterium]